MDRGTRALRRLVQQGQRGSIGREPGGSTSAARALEEAPWMADGGRLAGPAQEASRAHFQGPGPRIPARPNLLIGKLLVPAYPPRPTPRVRRRSALSGPPNAPLTPLAQALGRVPSGLYVVSTAGPDGPLAFVGSFVQQVGFEPPTVCVAIGKDRDHLAAIRATERFAISILDAGSQGLMGPFFKRYEGTETAFDHVAHEAAPGGAPVLTEALAWLDCRVSGEHELGDHIVVFGTVTDGKQLHDGDPSMHVRKNGLGY